MLRRARGPKPQAKFTGPKAAPQQVEGLLCQGASSQLPFLLKRASEGLTLYYRLSFMGTRQGKNEVPAF